MRERLIRWLVGGRDADAVAGDLAESGASGWGYWRQALSCLAVRLSPHRRLIPDLRMDLRLALRNIRRNPGYAVTAMLCLGLAMGVNATLFSFLDSLYLRPLPVPDAGRVVRVRRLNSPVCTWSEYLGFHDSLRSMEPAATLLFGGSADIGRLSVLIDAEGVSPNYARALRIGTALGRWFGTEDDSHGHEPGLVVSYHIWKSRLNGDPAVLGKAVLLEGTWYRLVGVAPEGFHGDLPPVSSDAWVSVASFATAEGFDPRLNVIGRLTPGATLANAAAEMRVLDARLGRTRDPMMVSGTSGFAGSGVKRYLQSVLPMGSVVCGMVLLIACVNVANLLLGRAAVRRREIAVRQALGAGRGRLFREALTEGAVLAAGGAALGALFGEATGRALETALPAIPNPLYHGFGLGVDWRVAAILTVAGALCALLFSLPAALESSRHGVNEAMKGDSFGRPSWQREIYTLVQVALSLALLIGTGLALRALNRVETSDPGFAVDHRLAVDLYPPPKMHTAKEGGPLFTKVLDAVRRIPGVVDATLAFAPLGPAPLRCASLSASGPAKRVASNTIEPNYFSMMAVPIVRGRGPGRFGAAETVVTETMARTWWPGDDAIGKTLWNGCGKTRTALQVVGVARDTRFALEEAPLPAFYVARQQDPGNGYFALVVRTAGDPYAWARPVTETIRDVGGPGLRVYEVQSLADARTLGYWEVKWRAALVAALGALAIVLAAIGLYGVVAYAVSRRTREIGVRVALGAAPGDVQWMVLAQGLRLTGIGIVLGLALSLATVRLLRGYLYGLSPFDPVAFGGACLAWIAIAMLASWFPARRATRVDPLVALRWE